MRGQAPGKIILFGEHAVVYGAPAIALPLKKRVVVTLRDKRAGRPALDIRLPRGAVVPDAHLAAAPTALLERALGPRFADLAIRVDLGVPPMAGFGSSAALAVAALRAIGAPKSKPRLLDLAIGVETIAHGTPSGIDPAVAIWETPIRFDRADRIRVRTLPIGGPVCFVVGTAGSHGGTAPVVARIGDTRRAAPALIGAAMTTLGAASEAGAQGLRQHDLELVGRAMRIANGVLDGFGLVGAPVKTALAILESAGALGAKMSGAGGSGGAFVALFRTASEARRAQRSLGQHGIQAWIEHYGR